ncbi:MAG: arsenate reductase family protein [Archangiaceae bacterium]|nr:arsenate reductase family protein [Archangiaceae bacterium]
MTTPLVLSYSGCSTCRRALKWLEQKKISAQVRPIVEQPPTVRELKEWIAKSGKPVKKWLNTSGLSYRALGKAKVDAASDATLIDWLAKDGKLVKRPVYVKGDTVLVGFKEEEWAERV